LFQFIHNSYEQGVNTLPHKFPNKKEKKIGKKLKQLQKLDTTIGQTFAKKKGTLEN